ncbi:MAG TPA: glycosyltransferase family 87 protein [Bryobacteraceae bacterium]
MKASEGASGGPTLVPAGLESRWASEAEACLSSTGRLTPSLRMDTFTWLLIWSVAAVLIGLPVLIQERILKEKRSIDFVYFYAISTIVRDSPAENIYNPEIEKAACQKILPLPNRESSYGPSPYPPFVALLFAPASRLPFWTAFRIDEAISLALYLTGLILLLRRYFPGQPSLSSLWVPFSLAYLPWISNAWLNGQLSALGFIGVAGALIEQKAGHRFRSGLALSVCLYKPTLLVLFIPMLLVGRQLRVLLGFAAGGCVLAGAATATFGWHIWAAYARLVLSVSNFERLRQSTTQFVDLAAFFKLLAGNRLGGVLVVLCTFCALPFLIASWRRYQHNPSLAWAGTLTWTLILSPYVPLYDTILIIPSLIASAGILWLGHRSAFEASMLLLFLCSWLSAALASLIHVQLLTLAIALVGALQLAATRVPGIECSDRVRDQIDGAGIAVPG